MGKKHTQMLSLSGSQFLFGECLITEVLTKEKPLSNTAQLKYHSVPFCSYTELHSQTWTEGVRAVLSPHIRLFCEFLENRENQYILQC